MAVYRITRFAATDMEKASKIAEEMRDTLEGVGADFIDMVSYGNGKGVIIAKYPTKEKMEAATETAKGICVSVHNTGAPIPSEHLPRLTERFYRVEKSRSRKLEGTGLGLSIVKHIVNHHGGTLEIESTEQKGTTFSVFFPIAE